ncbi:MULTISPECIES: DUF302 domain-containing protein [unclassified Mesorhizobium]|uniref:DUF302 domain-containing protein n=1 Tax=unclassified Mesorhizobium TaxID=325217 RepID=UPI00112AC014|nr:MULTISPECIES: DUF302 domain-containing protein [unclassified Mesorhizobium]MBZ9974102.1 DUF302 domain-containing protein [Mesorhizobium sp. BR-1-1-10]TPK10379.1 DUF302 domain-containing protein [Mesorhizobium sp. B2-5-7]
MSDGPSSLVKVVYGQPREGYAFHYAVAANSPFETVLETIRMVLREADVWIIHEIDPQMLLKNGGYIIARTRQILFFHPRYMVRLLGADPTALLEAPLKIVVMEDANAVTVRWPDPGLLFDRYGHDELVALGREFELIYAAIAARLT